MPGTRIYACRHSYFRCAAKVGKDAPKKEGTPFQAVSPPSLETPTSSAESRFASVAEAPGAYRYDNTGVVPAAGITRWQVRGSVVLITRKMRVIAGTLPYRVRKTASRDVGIFELNRRRRGDYFTFSKT